MKIKSISKAVLLLALLTSTSFAAGKNVNVEFRKGHSSAQYSGEIKGYDYDTYTFYAKKGQKVHVSISNEGADTYLSGQESMILLIYPDIPQNSIVTDNTHSLLLANMSCECCKLETTPVKTKLKNITSIFKLSKCQPTGTLPVINVNAPLLSVAQEVNDE
ncbi:periplasmic inhibitor of g-type lysozyme [Escherichia coli]|nr:periplasmic inhibitor of g-type lysozyme [Escherichia coli]